MTELTCKRRCVKHEEGENTFYTWDSRVEDPRKCPHCTSILWKEAKPEPRTESPEEQNKREIAEAFDKAYED